MHNLPTTLSKLDDKSTEDKDSKIIFLKVKKENGKSKRKYNNEGRWTYEEHQMFVDCLKKFGKNWKQIASVIKSRSGAQIRSHAQKFFFRLQNQYHQKNKKMQSQVNVNQDCESKLRNRFNSTDSYSLLENIDNEFYEKLNSMKKNKKDSISFSCNSSLSNPNNLQENNENDNISGSINSSDNHFDKNINYLSLFSSWIDNKNVLFDSVKITNDNISNEQTSNNTDSLKDQSYFSQIFYEFFQKKNFQSNPKLSDLVNLESSSNTQVNVVGKYRKNSFSKFTKSMDKHSSPLISAGIPTIQANSSNN